MALYLSGDPDSVRHYLSGNPDQVRHYVTGIPDSVRYYASGNPDGNPKSIHCARGVMLHDSAPRRRMSGKKSNQRTQPSRVSTSRAIDGPGSLRPRVALDTRSLRRSCLHETRPAIAQPKAPA